MHQKSVAWLPHFLQFLSYEEHKQVNVSEDKNIFKFDDNIIIQSLIKVQFPVNITGVSAAITADNVGFGIPLLLHKEALKKANPKVDF